MKAARIGGIVVAVLLLYVLSMGPVYGWYVVPLMQFYPEKHADPSAALDRVLARRQMIDTVYAPLVWLSDRSETVSKGVAWYVGLWTPRER